MVDNKNNSRKIFNKKIGIFNSPTIVDKGSPYLKKVIYTFGLFYLGNAILYERVLKNSLIIEFCKKVTHLIASLREDLFALFSNVHKPINMLIEGAHRLCQIKGIITGYRLITASRDDYVCRHKKAQSQHVFIPHPPILFPTHY